MKEAGLDCTVIAPSLVPREAGKAQKTDKIDARKLARYLSGGLLTEINIPDEQDESVRDLLRSRKFLTEQLVGVKNHINSLCRRLGRNNFQETRKKSRWSKHHLEAGCDGFHDPGVAGNLLFVPSLKTVGFGLFEKGFGFLIGKSRSFDPGGGTHALHGCHPTQPPQGFGDGFSEGIELAFILVDLRVRIRGVILMDSIEISIRTSISTHIL